MVKIKPKPIDTFNIRKIVIKCSLY